MGSELSSCCMSSPVRQNDLPDLQLEEDQQTSEELHRQVYDLIVEDRSDELQQLIYDQEIHIQEVLWKVGEVPLDLNSQVIR